MATQETVLVTGGTGYLGAWVCLLALKAGYKVRTTVRSLEKASVVRQMMIEGGASKELAESLEVVAADLTKDDGWPEACAGVTYIHHVASPFPMGQPKHEDDLIVPAREGTLRALRGAKAAGTVKRVVVTSSVAAIAYGHADGDGRTFTEADWTNLKSDVSVPAYMKSKTIAERAAWDYVEGEGKGIELATVNPGGLIGPVLSKSASSSVEVAVQMLNGSMPVVPKIWGGWVDVRDVADIHMKAMVDPKAAGQRYIAIGEGLWFRELAEYLKQGLGDRASKVGTMEMPNMILKVAALFSQSASFAASEVDHAKVCDGSKATRDLGLQYRPMKQTIAETGESLFKYGIV